MGQFHFTPAGYCDAADPRFDLPDRLDDQLAWLSAAGFDARATWAWKDLAVVVGDRDA